MKASLMKITFIVALGGEVYLIQVPLGHQIQRAIPALFPLLKTLAERLLESGILCV